MSKDTTFRNYTKDQAAAYAAGRDFSYPEPLYQAIFDYHTGDRNLLLDVGTGPGKVVYDLLPRFKYGIGCDAGVEMVEQAKRGAAQRDITNGTSFVVCGAEECFKAVPEDQQGTVDVVTVATAAHWFEMPEFYAAAAKALRSGGTLAIWTTSSFYCHPSTPNAAAVQGALTDLEDNMLGPYHTPSNLLVRDAYDNLPLPWNIAGFESALSEKSFVRHDWDRGGVPSAPPLEDGSAGPFLTHMEVSMDMFKRGLGSASSVTRWREANPEQANSEKDPVKLTIERMRELSGGQDKMVLTPSCTLLLMRKA